MVMSVGVILHRPSALFFEIGKGPVNDLTGLAE
jgi:hypothetical protein